MGLKYSKHSLHNSSLGNIEEVLHNKKNIDILKTKNVDEITDILENSVDENIPKTHKKSLSINYKYLIHSSLKKRNETMKHRYLEEHIHSKKNSVVSQDIEYEEVDTPYSVNVEHANRKNSYVSDVSSSGSNTPPSSSYNGNSNRDNSNTSYDTSEILSANKSPTIVRKSYVASSSPMKSMVEDTMKKEKFIMDEMKVLGMEDNSIHKESDTIVSKSRQMKFQSQISNDLHTKKKKSSIKKYTPQMRSKSNVESPCLFGKSLYTF